MTVLILIKFPHSLVRISSTRATTHIGYEQEKGNKLALREKHKMYYWSMEMLFWFSWERLFCHIDVQVGLSATWHILQPDILLDIILYLD